jgi:hypothetical protein
MRPTATGLDQSERGGFDTISPCGASFRQIKFSPNQANFRQFGAFSRKRRPTGFGALPRRTAFHSFPRLEESV